MSVGRGMTSPSKLCPAAAITIVDRSEGERLDQARRAASEKRGPMEVIMIISRLGMTQDIVTGTPPAFKAEARSAWVKRREEASIEGLFR